MSDRWTLLPSQNALNCQRICTATWLRNTGSSAKPPNLVLQIIRGEVVKGLPPLDVYMVAAEQRAAELRVLTGTPSRNRLSLL